MDRHSQIQKAEAFRKMHDRSAVLLLPNAWDAITARLCVHAGFSAVATTSGAIAWSLGYPDGELAPRAEVLAVTARIARAVDSPVTADIESGYGATADEVGETVRAVIEAGVVGINLEDGLHGDGRLRAIGAMAARIRAARTAASRAGVPIVINARTDVYLKQSGASVAEQFEETVRRGEAYLDAGADCIFPIGLGDGPTLGALVTALDCPINVVAAPGIPDMRELARLGVARVSTATRLAVVAISAVERALKEIHATGSFECLASELTRPQLQQLSGSG